jgi:hypothetical protein
MSMEWIKVEDRLPVPGDPVIAFVVDPSRPKWSRRIRAQYAAENTLELGCDHDPWEGCTQTEEGGDWFVEPGWYETNEYEDTHWRVTDVVTHWMLLPEPPTP